MNIINNIPLVKMINISKRFGRVQALRNVDLTINSGEVVGLLGDNGAGKSTLIKILVGMFPQDEGEIYFEGKKVNFKSPRDSRNYGIEVAYQGLGLVPLMNIVRNFFLGREMLCRRGPFKILDINEMSNIALKKVHDMGIKRVNDATSSVMSLSGGERQSICIGRAEYFGAKLLILDEPTASLSINETNKVLEYIDDAKNSGLSVIFITHNIYHVNQVAGRFVILEEGVVIGDIIKKDTTPEKIIDLIAKGKEVVETK